LPEAIYRSSTGLEEREAVTSTLDAERRTLAAGGRITVDIDKTKCVGCGNCHAVCTMGAITLDVDGKSIVNQDECVECSTCYRVLRDEGYGPSFVSAIRKVLSTFRLQFLAEVDVCPTGALTPPELSWPRNIRAAFSDPTVAHASTGGGGRGTEEMKTNDVSGRLGEGEVGVVVELGRPGTGARFRDLEKISMAMARLGARFEPDNPVTHLMADTTTGQIVPEVLDEKVLSAIIEIKTQLDRIPDYLQALEAIQSEVDTVFAVGVAARCLPDGSIPYQPWVTRAGCALSPNGKNNLGLGRPPFEEVNR
jgi:ferredoxin